MSTNDVPGHNPANRDELSMGCWAEHEDGSLIFVESSENHRVIFSIFDVSTDPVTEYRHAMPEDEFKETFSWSPDKGDEAKWTWHDKSPMPWDKVIRRGAQPGQRFASADDFLTAAQKVAQSLHARGQKVSDDRQRDIEAGEDQVMPRVVSIMARITESLDRLDKRTRKIAKRLNGRF